MQAMFRNFLVRLLRSTQVLIARLIPHTFQSLKLKRSAADRLELQFLSVRLNDQDFATRSERYAELVEWIRGIALSACRSAMVRYPAEREDFRQIASLFATSIPPFSHGGAVPLGMSVADFFDHIAAQPESRHVLEGIFLDRLGGGDVRG